MDYLRQVLGIKTEYQEEEQPHLPNYIRSRYTIRNVSLDGVSAAFVYPHSELDNVRTLQKHLDKIKAIANRPVVLVLEHLTYRQKEYLLRDKIPFVVTGKQIYLPFMAVYLQERCDAPQIGTAQMLPSAQLLLLHYIYQGTGELVMSSAIPTLGLTSTSISRATRQLESLGLVQTRREGVQKIIYSAESPQELYERGQAFLQSPVKRTVYLDVGLVDDHLLKGAESALAEYSMINEPEIRTYATDSIARWKEQLDDQLMDSEDQVAVELWRYNPHVLAQKDCVDPLSLALALRRDPDERIESAVDEMLRKVWEDIDGKRNREL